MSSHIARPRLLSYLDGELRRRERRLVERHLQSCWICRAEMDDLEDGIRTILDAQEKIFAHALPLPPKVWPSFDTLLTRKSFSRREQFFVLVHSLCRPLRVLAIPCTIIALIIVGLLMDRSVPVSAQEVIRQVKIAEAKQVIAKDQVLRERVHVRRRIHHKKENLTQVEEVSVWKSSESTYWDTPAGDSAATDLEALYRAHDVPIGLPLSMVSIEKWSLMAGGRANLSQEGENVGITFSSDPIDGKSTIARVNVVVQPKDWMVKQLTLDFADVSFEITEDATAVLPLNAAPKYLLAHLVPPAASEISLPRSEAKISEAYTRAQAVDLNATTLDVDFILHQLQADLGEPVTVTRFGQSLQVSLWQLPLARRRQVAEALQRIADVKIQSSVPASSFIREQKLVTYSDTASKSALDGAVPLSESDTQWRKFFTKDAEEEEYTRQALETSSTILAHLYALRNLQDQFSPEREARLSSERRMQLWALVIDHNVAAGSSLDQLQLQIDPLAAAFSAPAITPPACLPFSGWQSTSIEALDTAKVLDHLLRSLLATGETPLSPRITLPQIQHQLSQLSFEIKCLRSASH